MLTIFVYELNLNQSVFFFHKWTFHSMQLVTSIVWKALSASELHSFANIQQEFDHLSQNSETFFLQCHCEISLNEK